MSKELLEQMEHDYQNAFPIDVDWLLNYAKEQTKRVQELEEVRSDAIDQIDVAQRRNERLEQRVEELEEENKRYREFLEHTRGPSF